MKFCLGEMHYLKYTCNRGNQIFLFLKPLRIQIFRLSLSPCTLWVYPGKGGGGLHLRDCTIPSITIENTQQLF